MPDGMFQIWHVWRYSSNLIFGIQISYFDEIWILPTAKFLKLYVRVVNSIHSWNGSHKYQNVTLVIFFGFFGPHPNLVLEYSSTYFYLDWRLARVLMTWVMYILKVVVSYCTVIFETAIFIFTKFSWGGPCQVFPLSSFCTLLSYPIAW